MPVLIQFHLQSVPLQTVTLRPVMDQRAGQSKRCGEPLLQPRFRPLFVRNERGAAASPDR